MSSKITSFALSKTYFIQIVLFLFVNTLFIFKYVPRTGLNPLLVFTIYLLLILCVFFVYKKILINKFSEKAFKISYFLLLSIIISAIAFILIKVDPYSVRVDRWSAVTFFLDNLFQGDYPYAASTHVSETNFPSPFPVWYLVNLPFYFMKDVGVGLIFFLLFFTYLLQYFFASYKKSFLVVLLLFLSPAYWWEISVRSDSLSNVFLVLGFILWFSKKDFSLKNNFWLSVLACGLLASTRLSALLPLALFFFKPYTQLSWSKKILFPACVLLIVFITFAPFIFWNTENWVFFSRNPFMSQGSVGNNYVLGVMILLGIFMSFRWKTTSDFFAITSLFLFIFFISAQLTLVFTRGINGSIFEDSLYDISYFSLLLPYCLCYFASKIKIT